MYLIFESKQASSHIYLELLEYMEKIYLYIFDYNPLILFRCISIYLLLGDILKMNQYPYEIEYSFELILKRFEKYERETEGRKREVSEIRATLSQQRESEQQKKLDG
ncbi:MAG: hypothetical protein BWK79_03085 [Beggiatoa sp. IS2]|nr:MAG: hypothetical protein BWK79_03085 [Beggiatoa sp. IS2]